MAFGFPILAAGPTEYRYDGKTDPQIVRDLMRLAGHSDASIHARIERLMAEYLTRLTDEVARADCRVRLFAGMPELLDALEARDDMILGLLTGNLREGAAVKLRAAGIDPARFRVGAFGSDHASGRSSPRRCGAARARAPGTRDPRTLGGIGISNAILGASAARCTWMRVRPTAS